MKVTDIEDLISRVFDLHDKLEEWIDITVKQPYGWGDTFQWRLADGREITSMLRAGDDVIGNDAEGYICETYQYIWDGDREVRLDSGNITHWRIPPLLPPPPAS